MTHFELQLIATAAAIALAASIAWTAGHLGTAYAAPRAKRVLLGRLRRHRAARAERRRDRGQGWL